MQIVQELCRRPGLNKCGFEMPTIYIPNPQKVSIYSGQNFYLFIQHFTVEIADIHLTLTHFSSIDDYLVSLCFSRAAV